MNYPEPMDNSIAISKSEYIVSVTNSGITYADINGNTFSGTPTNWATWLNDPILFPTADFFDPRVLYDPVEDKFIVILLYERLSSNNPQIVIAVSVDGNPSNGFFVTTISGPGPGYWYDFPYLGQSDKDLFISVSQIPDNQNASIGTDIIQLEKTELYLNQNLNFVVYDDVTDFYNNNNIHICPSTHGSRDFNGTPIAYDVQGFYLVSNYNGTAATASFSIYDVVYDISPGFTPTLNIYGQNSNIYVGNAVPSPQKGSTESLNSNDSRVQSSFYLNKWMHIVFSARESAASGVATVYYARLNLGLGLYDITKIPTDIINGNATWQCYPSVCFMGANINDKTVYINYLYSSEEFFPGMRLVEIDDMLNISNTVDTKLGADYIDYNNGTSNRWGDYTGIQRVYQYNSCPKAVFNGSFGYTNHKYNEFIAENFCWPNNINEVSTEKGITLFPNPFHTDISLDANIEYGNAELKVFDITGRVVLSKQFFIHKGINALNLNLSHISSAQLLIKIVNNNKTIYNEIINKY
ncbi:MAG: T9SS type A sorting domain-containing protein [Bacteroidetes bacterium]|nr:T9SS type A sorting domain-containing protein [Bacteroidota bacterium]